MADDDFTRIELDQVVSEGARKTVVSDEELRSNPQTLSLQADAGTVRTVRRGSTPSFEFMPAPITYEYAEWTRRGVPSSSGMVVDFAWSVAGSGTAPPLLAITQTNLSPGATPVPFFSSAIVANPVPSGVPDLVMHDSIAISGVATADVHKLTFLRLAGFDTLAEPIYIHSLSVRYI